MLFLTRKSTASNVYLFKLRLFTYYFNFRQSDRQTLMFSATFPEDIQHLAGRFLNNYLFVAVGIVGGASSDVEQIFYEVSKYEKKTKLQELVTENGMCIVTEN